MDLSEFEKKDPHLLVGLVNTELRNHCEDLEDLCATHDINPEQLVSVLKSAGYDYLEDQKQFR